MKDGDPRSPDHQPFLSQLGAATYEGARVATLMMDILRTHCGVDYWELTQDTHGRLRAKLEASQERVPGLAEAIPLLTRAVELRNQLLHALLAQDGLHYRGKDKSVVDFYTVGDLRATTELFRHASRLGNELLYHDGGAGVRRLYEGS